MRRPLLIPLLALSVCAWQLRAETGAPDSPTNTSPIIDFYDTGPYRTDLPRPSDYFGYQTGEFLTTYALYESLLREYQAHSDRLRISIIGKTP